MTTTKHFSDALTWTRNDPARTDTPATYLPRYAQGAELDEATTVDQADEIHARYIALAKTTLLDETERDEACKQLWSDYAGRVEQLMGC